MNPAPVVRCPADDGEQGRWRAHVRATRSQGGGHQRARLRHPDAIAKRRRHPPTAGRVRPYESRVPAATSAYPVALKTMCTATAGQTRPVAHHERPGHGADRGERDRREMVLSRRELMREHEQRRREGDGGDRRRDAPAALPQEHVRADEHDPAEEELLHHRGADRVGERLGEERFGSDPSEEKVEATRPGRPRFRRRRPASRGERRRRRCRRARRPDGGEATRAAGSARRRRRPAHRGPPTRWPARSPRPSPAGTARMPPAGPEGPRRAHKRPRPADRGPSGGSSSAPPARAVDDGVDAVTTRRSRRRRRRTWRSG